MSAVVTAARRRIEREHEDVLEAVDACADAVAASWNREATSDRTAVVDPFQTVLEKRGVASRLPRVLADAVDATGHALSASPVPAPPYVVVTSRGPVLRATIGPGRLVIRLDVFEVVRGEPTRYRRRDGTDLVVSLE
ncbi:hypothetical protein [Natrialbaceae archaeon AArc-T1-2]|uniref:hypothetical protein n=1 Tax=Natrialbaceae archaeon AArc-T1-2 TaxID=3053904 RepID=UPI00255AE3F4|nr:hypothetical protein [Natrialbaceae archaeon AArc-T1-2]WIV65943.1 hypothetical protein QQ977_09555 [Natrialbaceae archaeon AArc-T1-2]